MLGMGGHAPNAYMLVYVRKDVQNSESSHSDRLLNSKVRQSFEREVSGQSASANTVNDALAGLFD